MLAGNMGHACFKPLSLHLSKKSLILPVILETVCLCPYLFEMDMLAAHVLQVEDLAFTLDEGDIERVSLPQ